MKASASKRSRITTETQPFGSRTTKEPYAKNENNNSKTLIRGYWKNIHGDNINAQISLIIEKYYGSDEYNLIIQHANNLVNFINDVKKTNLSDEMNEIIIRFEKELKLSPSNNLFVQG